MLVDVTVLPLNQGILDYGLMTRISEDKRVALIQYLMHVRCSARSLTSFSFETARLQSFRSLPRSKRTCMMSLELRCWKRFRIECKGTDPSDPSDPETLKWAESAWGACKTWSLWSSCLLAFPMTRIISLQNHSDVQSKRFKHERQTDPYLFCRRLHTDRQLILSNFKGL